MEDLGQLCKRREEDAEDQEEVPIGDGEDVTLLFGGLVCWIVFSFQL